MPDIYFKSVPFSKEDVTLALESGVDGIITEAEHVEGVRSLALCDVWAEADMPSVGLGSKAEEELAELRPYVAWYRQHGALLRGGDLHRLVDPEPNGLGAAWMITAKDGSEAAVFAVGDALTGSHGVASANSRPRLMLEGLDPAAQYTDEDANTYSGVQLLTTGLELPGGWGQTPAKIWYLKKV